MSRFHDEDAAGREQPRRLRDQGAIGVKPVCPAVKRVMRVVFAHVFCKPRDIR